MDRRNFVVSLLSYAACCLFGPSALAKYLNVIAHPYRGPLLDKIHDHLRLLNAGKLSHSQFVLQLGETFQQFDLKKELSFWLDMKPSTEIPGGLNFSFLSRQTSKNNQRRAELVLFYIPEDSAHPLHAHHDLSSTMSVLSGQLTVQQYTRSKPIENNIIQVHGRKEFQLATGGLLYTTEYQDNIHGFQAINAPALMINYNIFGYNKQTIDPKNSSTNERLYLNANDIDFSSSTSRCRVITEKEALRLYAQPSKKRQIS